MSTGGLAHQLLHLDVAIGLALGKQVDVLLWGSPSKPTTGGIDMLSGK